MRNPAYRGAMKRSWLALCVPIVACLAQPSIGAGVTFSPSGTGADTVQVGGMKRDFLNPKGFWFWAVSDNLRLSALNAVAAAESIFLR